MNKLIAAWEKAAEELAFWKAEEMRLRKELHLEVFKTSASGTRHFDLGEGFTLKCVESLTYKVDKPKALTLIAELQAEGVDTGHVLPLVPEFKVSAMKYLPAEVRGRIQDVLTSSYGTPALSIVEPKTNE